MNSLIKAVAECLTGPLTDDTLEPTTTVTTPHLNHHGKTPNRDEDLAASILNTLYAARDNDEKLSQILQDEVSTNGWSQSLATALLYGLQNALKAGVPMGEAMKDAFEKASNAAVGFAKEHPVYCTIIALGILVLFLPWAIEALGFGQLGPIEGSFAAMWQARYAGYVPKGSLFSFFQRLGMVWK